MSRQMASSGSVLVTDGHLRSCLAVVRSLGRQGISVICGARTRFATAQYSKYTDQTFVYPSAERSPSAFRDSLLSYLANNDRIDAVIPVGHYTTRCVSEYKGDFEEHTAVPVPEYEVFQHAWDKAQTFRTAAQLGIPRPETMFPESVTVAVSAAETLGYPVVVKPRSGSGSRGLRFVENDEELREAYASIVETDEPPLLQEMIPQDGEGIGTGFLFSADGESKAEFAYRRLREYPPDGGPSTLRESIEGDTIRRYGRTLLQELDWSGIAMVEFKRDPRDGDPKLMEINPRFWGSLHLPLHAGVNFPWLLWQYSQQTPTQEQSGYRTGVRCRYLYPGDLLYLLAERNLEAFQAMFPLRDEELYYDILSTDDLGGVVGRTLSLARYSLSPRMWKKLVVR